MFISDSVIVEQHSSIETKFHSLWLEGEGDSWPQLESDTRCDVAVVGGGIAGVVTLYYLMTETDLNVALFEKYQIASGASGHNAGLPTPQIERPIAELVQEFGLEKTRETYQELHNAKELLEEIHEKIGFSENLCPLSRANLGVTSIGPFLNWLGQRDFFYQLGYGDWIFWLVDSPENRVAVPAEYHAEIRWVTQEEIGIPLDARCIGKVELGPRVRMNTAALCNRVLGYLTKKYPDRCAIYEGANISSISLNEKGAILTCQNWSISANDVILCTNAYTDFSLFDAKGSPIDKLHKSIHPREGFLAAYPGQRSDSGLFGAVNEDSAYPNIPYWYLSVAPLTKDGQEKIACIGGPEYDLPASLSREFIDKISKESYEQITRYIGKGAPFSPTFFWHGTMGYTQSGLRWVGEDPDHDHLWYNLGCNGNGIYQSVAGGRKIAKQMCGEVFPPSLFDPLISGS